MSLAKQGYKSAIRGTAYTGVATNSDGFIASSSDTAVGTKTVQFTAVNAENSRELNQQIAATFFGFVPNMQQVNSYRMRVVWEV